MYPVAAVRGRVVTPGAAASSWWLPAGVSAANCIAAYRAIGAASLAASYVNLANPGTYDAAPGSAPSFNAADGWTFNGSSNYLDTGITPVNNQTWSAFVRFSDLTGSFHITLFGRVQTPRFAVNSSLAGSTVTYQNGSYAAAGGEIRSGVLGVAGVKGYRDGSDAGVTIGSSGGSFSATILIGQSGESGYEFWCNGKIQAIAIYDATLDATQAGLLTTAMAALT